MFPEIKSRRYAPKQRLRSAWVNEASDAIGLFDKIRGSGACNVRAARTGINVHVPIDGKPVLFVLSEDFRMPDPTRTAGSSSEPDVPWCENAMPVAYEPYNYIYHTPALNPQTIYAPACFRNTNNIAVGPIPWCQHQRLWCIYNTQSGRWEVLEHVPLEWQFECKDTITPGGVDYTVYLYANIGDGIRTVEDVTFEVRLPRGNSSWMGVGKDTPWAEHGSYGIARYMSDWAFVGGGSHRDEAWYIVSPSPHARVIIGQAKSDFGSTDDIVLAGGTIQVVDPRGGDMVVHDPATDLTIGNQWGWEGSANEFVLAQFDGASVGPQSTTWIPIQKTC